MSLSNIMNVWLSSADTANCTLTAALAGSRLETVMNFNIGDDWESFQYRQHGHAGAFNLWSDAPEFAYLSDSRIYSCRSEIADIKSYTFTTNGIVPVTGLRSTASKDDVLELTSDFYTEDFIIWPEGQTDVLEYQLVKEPPYGFRITNSFIAGKVSAIIESEPYGYLESLNNNGIVQLDMTNRKNRRINLTAYHEGESYVVNQQTVLSVELFDIFELESNSQFKTDFAYFGGNGVQLVLVGDSRPLSAIGYENNYRRSAVQAVSPTLEYEGGLAPVDVSQLRVRAIAKNTNLQISGDVGVHVDTTVRSVKAYHYTNGSYKLMQEGYSMKLSAMDQLDTIRFNIPVEIVSRDAYESHTGGTGGTDYAGDYMDCILEEADDKLMLVALHKVYSNSNGDNPSPISVYVSSPAYHLTGCVQFYIDAAENALSTINIIDNRPMTIENNMSVLLDVDRPFASITEYDEAELTATALTSDM